MIACHSPTTTTSNASTARNRSPSATLSTWSPSPASISATDELVQMCRSGVRWAAVRMASTTTWSTCSCVISTASAPSSASGAENDAGPITSVLPACSRRMHEWPSLRSRIPLQAYRDRAGRPSPVRRPVRLALVPTSLPRSSPVEQHVDPAGILAFLDALDGRPDIEMHSIMLVRHGHVVAEGWWRPYSAERPHRLYSLSKSFTSTAAAFAAAEGLLDLDDTVVSHFPEFEADITDPGSRSMRIRHIAAEHPEQECRSQPARVHSVVQHALRRRSRPLGWRWRDRPTRTTLLGRTENRRELVQRQRDAQSRHDMGLPCPVRA